MAGSLMLRWLEPITGNRAGGHRHEHQADREQHLVEMGAAVHVTIERALEARSPSAAATMKRRRQAGEERHGRSDPSGSP